MRYLYMSSALFVLNLMQLENKNNYDILYSVKVILFLI